MGEMKSEALERREDRKLFGRRFYRFAMKRFVDRDFGLPNVWSYRCLQNLN